MSITFDQAYNAIKRGNQALLRRALHEGLDANLSNKSSWTLLMLAGMAGNTAIGEMLIEHGAKLDRMNDAGETALSFAMHKGHERFVKMLLAKGASLNCRPYGHSLESFVTIASGLSPKKIERILGLVGKSPVPNSSKYPPR